MYSPHVAVVSTDLATIRNHEGGTCRERKEMDREKCRRNP